MRLIQRSTICTTVNEVEEKIKLYQTNNNKLVTKNIIDVMMVERLSAASDIDSKCNKSIIKSSNLSNNERKLQLLKY